MKIKPRFSLRMLFVVVTVFAVFLGWICWSRHVVLMRANLLLWCEQNRVGYIATGDRYEGGINDLNHGGLESTASDGSSSLSWIRKWLGDRNVMYFVSGDIPPENFDKLTEIKSWFPEARFTDGVPLAHNRPIKSPDGKIRAPTFIPR